MAEPTSDMLATAAGLATVVWLIMSVVRTLFDPVRFDKIGPALACVVGIVLAIIYTVFNPPFDGNALIQAVLVGLFGGWMSQNVNTTVQRLRASP